MVQWYFPFLATLFAPPTIGFTELRPLLPSSLTKRNSQFSQQIMASMTQLDDPGISMSLPFDDETWEVYVETMADVMNSNRVLKKDKPEDVQPVKDYLISKSCIMDVSTASNPIPPSKQDIQAIMADRRSVFTQHYNFSSSQLDFAMRALVYMGDACAKRRLALPIAVAWEKLKETGILPRENSFSTFMFILSLDEEETICNQALSEVAAYHSLLFKPNEKTVFLRIKSLVNRLEIDEAETVLASLPEESGECTRLRTFQPILQHYAKVGDPSAILRLFRDMRNSKGVILDAETYGLVLSSLARLGCFRVENTMPIENAAKAGFTSSCGPALFDEIASEMGEDILELTEEVARQMEEAFCEGFQIKESERESLNSISRLSSTTPTRSVNVGKVEIDSASGTCLFSGSKLRLFSLDEDQRQHVHDTLLEMARLSYQEFSKKSKKKLKEDENYGYSQLLQFSEWLDNREGEPFTAVVDGANVAYYGYPELHYVQVQLVVDKLEEMGEKPLVILPKKYTYPTFKLSHNDQTQILPKRDVEVLQRLQDEGKMYSVPQRCLDDYFWMLASVSNQTLSRQNCDMLVSTDDGEGRFPGLRPILITNDFMRDHKLSLLEPREFRRWCSCHIVKYDVGAYEEDEWEDGRLVSFDPADFFSREIQGNPHSRGGGIAWHFPITTWNNTERFCIWIQR